MIVNIQCLEGKSIADRYRLLRYLDGGCFGAVYMAEQMAYGVGLREVAIKIARKPMSDEEARATFHDALIMTRVVDNIADPVLRDHFITVHDAGRCSDDDGPLAGHPYMVMELVRGSGLHHHLRPGPMPLKRAMACFDQMLTAMVFMHRGVREDDGRMRPVVHRDLKPANFLVVRREDREIIKITDFGLAVTVESLLGWTESGGTIDYLAPESFSHDICSPQSDIWALALIFYEMVTGSQPFARVGRYLGGEAEPDNAEYRRLHLKARQMEHYPLLEQHEELHRLPGLIRVLRNALAPNMGSRVYQNASEMQADWERAKKEGEREVQEMPWDKVRRLLGSAEQCYGVGDKAEGDRLLDLAMNLNRDRVQVPDRLCNGRCYLLAVNRLIRQNRMTDAGKLAMEGKQRRSCRSTLLGIAAYYRAVKSPNGAQLLRLAEECKDRE